MSWLHPDQLSRIVHQVRVVQRAAGHETGFVFGGLILLINEDVLRRDPPGVEIHVRVAGEGSRGEHAKAEEAEDEVFCVGRHSVVDTKLLVTGFRTSLGEKRRRQLRALPVQGNDAQAQPSDSKVGSACPDPNGLAALDQ